MLPFMRLYGTEGDTVFFVHTSAQTPVELTGVDTLVVVGPNKPRDELAATCRKLGIEHHIVGDALSPRTAEEAVFEGARSRRRRLKEQDLPDHRHHPCRSADR